MIWRIAWRNLWRNRGRTFILISVIAMTYGATLLGISISDDSHRRMLDEAVLAAGGDILIHGEEYWGTRASDIVIQGGESVASRARSTLGVGNVFPRVLVQGLLSTSAASRPVFLQGVEPDAEDQWRGLSADLVTGTFLQGEEDDPLVLGTRLAERLEVEMGDRVVLTATGPDGDVRRALFHVAGTIETGAREVDEQIAFTTVLAAREALSMDDQLTQVGLVLADGADVDEVARSLRENLTPDLEVLTWRDAVPEMVGFIELDDGFGYIYLAVIFIVVLFAITNTFLMAVMERVREFGLLSALGLKGAKVGQLLLAETALLTAVAMAVGFSIGLAGHFAADTWGINLGMYGIEEMEISGIDMADMIIRSTINPMKWLAASALVFGASILSAVYPAWKATSLAPAEAMRFYE